MTTFKEMGLNLEIMKSLDDLGFTEPSPVQEKVIPYILKSPASPSGLGGKKDLIALAQTGTGKTAAFGLPILNQIKPNGGILQAIILCPTRELCIQIADDIEKMAKYSRGVKVTPVYGGARIDFQMRSLRSGTNIVVGTPGRVHDLIRRKALRLHNIEWLVLDEADEMLDMGFKEDLDAILEQTPTARQTLLFSATISRSVQSIAKRYMKEAEEISIGEKNIGAENVAHEYYVVGYKDRFEALKRILDSLPGVYGILFCRTKIETQDIADKLKRADYDTEALHGDVSQSMRTKIMDRFKRKYAGLLVATDVAARGIDVSDLSHVINYNLPDQNGSYTHRSGRTGRAKKSGVCISLLGPRDVRRVRELENVIGKRFECKKVPSGKEVLNRQIDIFFEAVEKSKTQKVNNKEDFQEIVEKLKKIDKEDLIKYFVTRQLGHILDAYKNNRDLNTSLTRETGIRRGDREDKEGYISLKVDIGKRDGIDIKGFFALINSNRNLKGLDIGRIDLMPEYSIFSVGKSDVDRVFKYLGESRFRGKKIGVEKSNEVASYRGRERKSRSSRGRGFRGNGRRTRRSR